MKTKKSILLVLEKPSLYSEYMKNEKFREFILKYEIIKVFYSYPVFGQAFKYPHGLKYKDYPLVSNVEYKALNESNNSETNDYSIYKDRLLNSDHFETDDIAFLTDYDYVGIHHAYKNLELYWGTKDWECKYNNIYRSKVLSFSSPKFDKNIKNMLLDEPTLKNEIANEYIYLDNYGQIKRYFDYNYNLNANVFFNEIMKKKFSFTKNISITKYMILTLFLIDNELVKRYKDGSLSEANIIVYLGSTYRKELYKGKPCNVNIGTPISFCEIVKNLIKIGFVEKQEGLKGDLVLTPLFHEFLQLLNKRMYDKFLPVRLEEWCSTLSFDEAKIKIDKYLLDMFGHQKRKNNYL